MEKTVVFLFLVFFVFEQSSKVATFVLLSYHYNAHIYFKVRWTFWCKTELHGTFTNATNYNV